MDYRVIPPAERGGEQAELQGDRPGREHRRAHHGEVIRHRQQLLVQCGAPAAVRHGRGQLGLGRPHRGVPPAVASREAGRRGHQGRRPVSVARLDEQPGPLVPGELGRGERLAARRGQGVQPGPVVPDERQADQLAGFHRPRVRLADPLAVGGRGGDKLVGRLERTGQGHARSLAGPRQVQVPRDRRLLGKPGEGGELHAKGRLAELEQRDGKHAQVRFQHQFGLIGGACDGGKFLGDPQPFGRGARLPAHVGQREQRIGEHAGIIGRPGTFHRTRR